MFLQNSNLGMRNGQFGESLLCFGSLWNVSTFVSLFCRSQDRRVVLKSLAWLGWGQLVSRPCLTSRSAISYLTGVIPASCTSADTRVCARLVVKYKCSRLCRFNRNYQLSSEQGKDWGSGASLDLWSDWVTTVLCCESQDWVATSCHCVLL